MAEKLQTKIASVMEDPSAVQIARVYAKSFLEAAKNTVGVEAALEEGQSFVDDVLTKNGEFERLLVSPTINRDDKLKLIERVVTGRGSEFFTSFLKVLARHDRLDLLPNVLQAAQEFRTSGRVVASESRLRQRSRCRRSLVKRSATSCERRLRLNRFLKRRRTRR